MEGPRNAGTRNYLRKALTTDLAVNCPSSIQLKGTADPFPQVPLIYLSGAVGHGLVSFTNSW